MSPHRAKPQVQESESAEIQRLREELALRDDSLANRRVRELRAERDRYRDALERIAKQDAHAPGWTYWREIAREALDV